MFLAHLVCFLSVTALAASNPLAFNDGQALQPRDSSTASNTMQSPAVPTSVAPISNYDVNLPAFPKAYSDAEKAAQAQAGTKLISELNDVFQQHLNTSGHGNGSLTVPPGVYRVSEKITIPNVLNFKLVMSNVELVTTDNDNTFLIAGSQNLEIVGPLYLDADPIPESQGVIVGTDGKSYVDVRTMPGYRMPNIGSRLKCFNKQGVMQRHYQDSIATVEDRGNDVYRVSTQLGAGTYEDFPCLAEGNYFATEGNKTTQAGGINFQGVGDVYWHEVYHYSPALTFCQNVQGTLKLDHWMGQRRPGTNRLGAGGWMLCQFDGGSLDMTRSEISQNYDDLTDLGGYQSSAIAGPSPNQIYTDSVHLVVGRVFKFYDATNLAYIGEASITKVDDDNVTDPNVLNMINAKLQAAQAIHTLQSQHQTALITMSSAISGQSGYYFADDISSRPKLLSIRDSYLHDGYASGIQMKGANKIVATGNVVERSAITGLATSFSVYWSEGGVSNNIFFDNNTIVDTPYSIGMTGSAISMASDTTQLAHAVDIPVSSNVTITNNVIINPQLSGINICTAENITIASNSIYNIGSVKPSDPSLTPFGIGLQTSKNAVIQDNVVHVSNASAGFNASTLVIANNRTDLKTVKNVGNKVVMAPELAQVKIDSIEGDATPPIADLDTSLHQDGV